MEKSFDAGLWIRRLILTAISIGVGFAITAFFVYAELRFPTIIPIESLPFPDIIELTPLTAQGKQFTLNTTFEDYGLRYTVLTTLAIAVALGIWLDKFLNTKILPN